MKKKRNMLQIFWGLLDRFIPLILLQAIIFSMLNAYYMLLRPLLMQSLFAALESAKLNETAEVCVLYTCLLLTGILFCYLNNVILDSNLFKAIHIAAANIFSRWHKNRKDAVQQGVVFQDVTEGAASMVSAPIHALNLFVTVGTLGYILYFSTKASESMPWILSVTLTVAVGINLWQFRLLHKRTNVQQESLGIAEADFQRLFSEMQVLKFHTYFEPRQRQYKGFRQNAWKARIKVENTAAFGDLLINVLVAIAFTIFFATISLGADETVVRMANLAVAVSLLQSVARNVGELMYSMRCMTDVIVPMERVTSLLEDTTKEACLDMEKPAVLIEWGKKQIELKQKQRVAIVGYNGSGKTALLNQIAGIPYQRLEAKVTLFGEEPLTLSFKNRRKLLAVAPKEDSLFDARVEENILMNAESDEEKSISRLAAIMKAEYLIAYESSQLSGGQEKITNLLRSCIHSSNILIADEPTGSLDYENAECAMKLLYETAKDKLLIVVTHDMALLKEFDLILYMEDLSIAFAGDYAAFSKSLYYSKLKENV